MSTTTTMLQNKTPKEVRALIRKQEYTGPTNGLCAGHAQVNLCILPKEDAFDFLLFCQRNPKPCPLIECLEGGVFNFGDDIDVRTDFPKYRIYKEGVLVEECHDISGVWRDDFVTFLIGCSFSFEDAMQRAGLPLRHNEPQPTSISTTTTTTTTPATKTVPMYRTHLACVPAGKFSGNQVVSMRPMTTQQAIFATQITSRFPRVHGSPVHIGNPSLIGIDNINKPDFGDAVVVMEEKGEVPVFWSCGVTPQAVVMQSKPLLCITHSPGHMLILDTLNETLSLN